LRGSGDERLAERLLADIAAEASEDVDNSTFLRRLRELRSRDLSDEEGEMIADQEGFQEEAEWLLAIVNQWASLASYVSSSVYGPASPMPKRLAGWGQNASAQLQKLSKVLLKPLAAAAPMVGASGWSISLGFPWGVSIGLSWP
jgi:hypothetical protein